MTVTNQYVPPIEPGVMPGGLQQTARRLPAGSDWTGGITFTPSCASTGVWGCVTDGSEKTITERSEPVRFDPFLIYSGMTCQGTAVEDEMRDLTRAAILRGTSRELAKELVFSDPMIGNPDLTTLATDITSGSGPQPVKDSVAGLLSALDECGGGDALLHVPMVALPYMLELHMLKERDGLYYFGAVPVSVDHYPVPGGGASADPDEAYFFLTRMVEYETGEGIDLSHYTGRLNQQIVMPEQLAILRFDPCCAYSINVDLGSS